MTDKKKGKPKLSLVDKLTLEELEELDEQIAEKLEEGQVDPSEFDEEDQKKFGISGLELRELSFTFDKDNRRKSIQMNRKNAATILRKCVATRRMLGFDEFAKGIVLFHPVPEVWFDTDHDCLTQTDPPLFDKPKPLEDRHIGQVQMLLQHIAHLPHCSDTLAYQAIETVAYEHCFHPIREYLRGIKWDGTPRVRTVFTDCFGTEDTEYTRKVAEIFFVSGVKRIFEPGCKADYVTILEGEEGLLKSTFFSILAGDYFTDGMGGNVESKDAMQHLRAKWIVEFAELTTVKRSEVEGMKAFVTRQVEKYRPAYGRLEVTEPRQCIFGGTTNEVGYLKSTTGNRRMLPIATYKRLDVDWFKSIRDQLWAEAMRMYKDGVQNWPDPEFEKKWMKPQQEARTIEDPWVDLLATWLAQPIVAKNKAERTYSGIFEKGLKLAPKDVNPFIKARVKKIMLGFGYKTMRVGPNRYWLTPEEYTLYAAKYGIDDTDK